MKKVTFLKKLIQGDRKYRDLFEHNRDGVYITTVDGKIVDVNQSVLTMTGYTRNGFLKTKSLQHYVNLSERRKFQVEIKKKGFVKDFLVKLKTKKGKELYCLLTSTALRDESKNIIGYHGIIHDVTESKRKEEQIIESEKKFRDLFESAPDPIFIESYDGIVVDANHAACNLHGMRYENIIGKHFLELIPEKHREQVRSNIENFIRNNIEIVESFSIGPAGESIPVEIRTNVIRYREKPALLLHVRDVTERNKAEENLKISRDQLRMLAKHINRVREEESTRIARELHDELGQTVTVLKLQLSYINVKISAGNLAGSDMDDLKEKSSAMVALINSTIDSVRRISANLRPAILDDLGLLPAIEWYAEDLRKRSGLQCDVIISDVDEKNLKNEISTAVFRIVQEAITNALKHSKATKINITIGQRDKILTVKIADDGSGIEKSNPEANGKYGMLGMKERAISVGGELKIFSEMKKGTTLLLTIPLA